MVKRPGMLLMLLVVLPLLLTLLGSSPCVVAKKGSKRYGRNKKKRPWSPEGKKGNGEVQRDKPFLYTAENGYPDGRPWYLDDMVVNLAFASAIMFIIWLPNILFRAPKNTGRRVTKEMYRKQE